MKHRDLFLEAVRLFSEERKNYQQIANSLNTSEEPVTAENASDLVKEGGRWLLRRHKRLEDLEALALLSDELAQGLRQRYGFLLDAKVVRFRPINDERDYRALLKIWGRVAADLFDEIVAERRVDDYQVIFSGGETILEMVSALPDHPRPHVHFYPAALIGRGRMPDSTHVGPETNATLAWARSGRRPGHLNYATVSPAETAFDDPTGTRKISLKQHQARLGFIQEELEHLYKTQAVRLVLKDMANADMAIVGLGLPQPDPGMGSPDQFGMAGLVRGLGLNPQFILDDGAIGDISYCFYAADGSTKPEWNIFFTPGYPQKTGLAFYKGMVQNGDPVMAIAGYQKTSMIRSALEARMINVLVTDEHTARELLS